MSLRIFRSQSRAAVFGTLEQVKVQIYIYKDVQWMEMMHIYRDVYFDFELESARLRGFNQGNRGICTCPSRAVIHEDIYEPFMAMVEERVNMLRRQLRASKKLGKAFDLNTQVGAQASNEQFEKIMSYMDVGVQEGAKVLDLHFGGDYESVRWKKGLWTLQQSGG